MSTKQRLPYAFIGLIVLLFALATLPGFMNEPLECIVSDADAGMRKNASNQVVCAHLNTTAGVGHTSGTTTVYYHPNATTQTSAGTASSVANGVWCYTITDAAVTNQDLVKLLWVNTGAVSVLQVYPTVGYDESGSYVPANVTHVNGTAQTARDLGAGVIVNAIDSGAIQAADFASGAIDATAIAADAIGASELATDAIGAAEIAASTITSSEAPNLDAAVSTRSTYAGGDTSGTTTLLTRVVGTLAAGTHNPQSGDSYARIGAAGAGLTAVTATLANGAHGGASASLTLGGGASISSSTGNALTLTSTGGAGLYATTNVVNRYAIEAVGTGATDSGGIKGKATTAGEGIEGEGGGNGHGAYFLGAGTGDGLHAVGGGGTGAHGAYFQGSGTNSNGLTLASTGTGVDLYAPEITGAITGNITGNLSGSVGSVTGAVGSVASGGITAASVATGAIDADALATDAGTELADATWDEALAGHLGAGSTGAALNAAGAAGDPWGISIPGAYGAGTAGHILGTNLDATVSSRLPTSSYTASVAAPPMLPAAPNSALLFLGETGLVLTDVEVASSGYGYAEGVVIGGGPSALGELNDLGGGWYAVTTNFTGDANNTGFAVVRKIADPTVNGLIAVRGKAAHPTDLAPLSEELLWARLDRRFGINYWNWSVPGNVTVTFDGTISPTGHIRFVIAGSDPELEIGRLTASGWTQNPGYLELTDESTLRLDLSQCSAGILTINIPHAGSATPVPFRVRIPPSPDGGLILNVLRSGVAVGYSGGTYEDALADAVNVDTAAIAAAVRDVDNSSPAAGSLGEGVANAGTASNPWSALTADNAAAGSFGEHVQSLALQATLLGQLTPGVLQASITVTEGTPRSIVRGDVTTLTFTTARNLTGKRAFFAVAKDHAAATAKIVNSEATITDAATGVATITLTPAETATAGSYYWDLEITDADGASNPSTAMTGRLLISDDVRK